MNIPETYDYLVRARRNLWAGLEGRGPTSHLASHRVGRKGTGKWPRPALLLHEVQRALQFQLEFCALGQVQLVAATGLHEVRC